MFAVYADTADAFRNPCRVAGENFVVFGCTGEFNKTKLHYEMVDKLLSFLLRNNTCFEISFYINIEECGSSSETHCCTVLFLNRCKVTEIQPLYGFVRILSRAGYIISVYSTEFFQFFQCTKLLAEFFAQTNCF